MKKGRVTRQAIIELFDPAGPPLHAREITTRLGLRPVDFREVSEMLEELASRGDIKAMAGQRFRLAEARPLSQTYPGRFTYNPRGFGFVAVDDPNVPDIYIPSEGLGGAMHRDKVVVRVRSKSARGLEGVIEEVTARASQKVSGTLVVRGQSAWVEPDDARIAGPIVLPMTDERDLSAERGKACIVEIVRYPSVSGEQPVGRMCEVLGEPGAIAVETKKILLLSDVVEPFPTEVLAEVAALPAFEVLAEGREDLRDIPFCTIDPADAKDHDDAVHVDRTEDGGYIAHVAIADVSSYVVSGTLLDGEAERRATSVYLPDRAIPMLPHVLSGDACSLLPQRDRLSLVATMHLSAAGAVTRTELRRAVIRSAAKLSYEGVAALLGLYSDIPVPEEGVPLCDNLRVAYELSRLLRGRRRKRGALDFEVAEPMVVLDPTGEPTNVVKRGSIAAVKRTYELIEELMLLANEQVARWLIERGSAAVYRVHAAPDAQKMQRFLDLAATVGLEVPDDLVESPKNLSRFVASLSDHPASALLQTALLRSMKQATYDVHNTGHFGLASDAYLHFTSPIRRYPDLVVHRLVHHLLLGKQVVTSEDHLKRLAEQAAQSSARERVAADVERDVVDVYRATVMKKRVGDTFQGTVSAVVGSGLFVQVAEPFCDVLVLLEDLGQDSYQADDSGLWVTAARSGERISLGDPMTVRILDANLARRVVYGRRERPLGGGHRRGSVRPTERKGQAKEMRKGRKQKGGKGGAAGKARKPKGGRR